MAQPAQKVSSFHSRLSQNRGSFAMSNRSDASDQNQSQVSLFNFERETNILQVMQPPHSKKTGRAVGLIGQFEHVLNELKTRNEEHRADIQLMNTHIQSEVRLQDFVRSITRSRIQNETPARPGPDARNKTTPSGISEGWDAAVPPGSTRVPLMGQTHSESPQTFGVLFGRLREFRRAHTRLVDQIGEEEAVTKNLVNLLAQMQRDIVS